ncbi:hypothetical protein [Kineosporia sp. R_H_3]|jgi:uncharacterized protein YfeS|uniref:hypothetical protein n=1 Tax=Kineosporia sp. R_H_3 TaxID=1961848 RepID=UPI000B4BB508|nr:hypothetical protein [Kineosporia sp. R_H_3]
MDDVTAAYPKAPAFAAHFTDPLYDDLADEFAPFGSDEGADMLADWVHGPEDLTAASTYRDVLSAFTDDVEALVMEAHAGAMDLAAVVLGGCFTLLRLTGRIDPEGRRVLLDTLDVMEREYGAEQFRTMRRDVLALRG